MQRLRGLLDEHLSHAQFARGAARSRHGNLLFVERRVWHQEVVGTASSRSPSRRPTAALQRCARVEVSGLTGQSLGKHNLQTVLICGKRRYKASILTKARLAQWTEPPEVKMHASMTSMRAEIYHCDGKETRGAAGARRVSIAQLGHGTAEIRPVADGQGRGRAPAKSVWDTPSTEGAHDRVPVRIVRARDLAKADTFGLSDPYCGQVARGWQWRARSSGTPGQTRHAQSVLVDALIKVQMPHAGTDAPAVAADGGAGAGAGAGAGSPRRGPRRGRYRGRWRRGRRSRRDASTTSQEDELLIGVWDGLSGQATSSGRPRFPQACCAARPAPTTPRKSSALTECTELWRSRKRMPAPI